MSSFDVGILTGAVSGFLGVVIIAKIKNHRQKKQGKTKVYDERQKAIQLKSTVIALWCFTILTSILGIIEDAGLVLFTNHIAEFLTIMVLACIVYVFCNIIKDSYYSVHDNPKKYAVSFLITGIFFAIFSIMMIVKGEIIQDGKLTVFLCYPIISVMMLGISLGTIIRMKINQKAEESEE